MGASSKPKSKSKAKSKSKPKPKPVRIVLSRDPTHRLEGYHVTDANTARRREALLRAVLRRRNAPRPRATMLKVQRRVQVLALFFKKSRPLLARRAKADAAYLSAFRKKCTANA